MYWRGVEPPDGTTNQSSLNTFKREKRGVIDRDSKVIRVVVKTMVPFWILIIIRHLILRVPKMGP